MKLGLLGGGGFRVPLVHRALILNVPNAGLLRDLDNEAMIEVPSRVAADGIQALPTSELPDHARGLVQQVKYVERCELTAAEEESAAAAIRAFAAHPSRRFAERGEKHVHQIPRTVARSRLPPLSPTLRKVIHDLARVRVVSH